MKAIKAERTWGDIQEFPITRIDIEPPYSQRASFTRDEQGWHVNGGGVVLGETFEEAFQRWFDTGKPKVVR